MTFDPERQNTAPQQQTVESGEYSSEGNRWENLHDVAAYEHEVIANVAESKNVVPSADDQEQMQNIYAALGVPYPEASEPTSLVAHDGKFFADGGLSVGEHGLDTAKDTRTTWKKPENRSADEERALQEEIERGFRERSRVAAEERRRKDEELHKESRRLIEEHQALKRNSAAISQNASTPQRPSTRIYDREFGERGDGPGRASDASVAVSKIPNEMGEERMERVERRTLDQGMEQKRDREVFDAITEAEEQMRDTQEVADAVLGHAKDTESLRDDVKDARERIDRERGERTESYEFHGRA